MKREAPRGTFDTPSRTIVIEPIRPVAGGHEADLADLLERTPLPPDADPSRRDDDTRSAPA